MTVCAVLAFGIGMILRHTAGAITASTALLFVVPLLVTLLPQAWQDDVNKWVPTYAGDEIFTGRPDPRTRPCRICSRRGGGFAVLAGYAAVALAGGMVAFRRPTREAAPGRSSVGSTRRILMSKQTEQVASWRWGADGGVGVEPAVVSMLNGTAAPAASPPGKESVTALPASPAVTTANQPLVRSASRCTAKFQVKEASSAPSAAVTQIGLSAERRGQEPNTMRLGSTR